LIASQGCQSNSEWSCNTANQPSPAKGHFLSSLMPDSPIVVTKQKK